MHWDNFSEVFDVHSTSSSRMSLSSINLGPGNEFPGVALVTGAAGSGEDLKNALCNGGADDVVNVKA
jgi:hypothetical protein